MRKFVLDLAKQFSISYKDDTDIGEPTSAAQKKGIRFTPKPRMRHVPRRMLSHKKRPQQQNFKTI
jgi:hypothetical protein